MDNFVTVIGILATYFAVLLVLSVAVETILDPFTLFKGLQKKVSPEEYTKDKKSWLPGGSQAETDASSIANFIKEFNVDVKDIETQAKEIGVIATETANALGLSQQVKDTQKKLAIQLYAIRTKYNLDEQKRIVILRILSAIIGIVLAFLLQIDTFKLLADLLSAEALNVLSTWQAHIGGMVLTGLAASAGSSFWHDQLGKVRALKEIAQGGQEAKG